MAQHLRKALCIVLMSAMLAGLGACGTQEPEKSPMESEEERATVFEEAPEEPAAAETAENTEAALSETALAEQAIIGALDYSQYNFQTESEFYRALKEILALHGLELTRYPGDNAYYYFNYNNVTSVRLLTIAKTMDQIEADRVQAQADYEEEKREFEARKAAIAAGESYEAPEDVLETAEADSVEFDAEKDVDNSEDYVVSFVMSAADYEVDQQLLFLVSAAVWCIMSPRYDNTDAAFDYLWRALYNTYIHSGGLAASTIDGFDTSYSFTIPGNGLEAWLGTDDSGNYVLAITPYVKYDEIIDISSGGADIQSAVSGMSSLYG